MWLFGAIGRTVDWGQPASRYTLDNRYISTETAEVKNETSYNELLAYFPNLDSSYHTLVVENVNESATLFLDYYLVEPMPTEELTKSSGNLQTGGVPVSTSISERPIYIKNTNLSKNAAIGSLVGAVVGGILLAFIIAIVAFIIWRRRGGSKPYYYRRAAVHEVLVDGAQRHPDFVAIGPDCLYRVEAQQHRIGEGIGSFYNYPLPLFPFHRRRYTAKYTANSSPDEDRHVSKQSILFGQRSQSVIPTTKLLPYALRISNTEPACKTQVPRRLEIVASPVEFTAHVRFTSKVVIIFKLVVLYTFIRPFFITGRPTAPLARAIIGLPFSVPFAVFSCICIYRVTSLGSTHFSLDILYYIYNRVRVSLLEVEILVRWHPVYMCCFRIRVRDRKIQGFFFRHITCPIHQRPRVSPACTRRCHDYPRARAHSP